MEVYPVKTASILPLGKQGENLVRQIQFDLSHWISNFGPGTVQLLHQRSGDEAPYPVAVEQEGNLAVWTVTNADTAAAGTGRAELQYYVGDALAKSETWTTQVLPALGAAGETPPKAQQGWVDQVLQAGTEVAKAASAAIHQPMVGSNGNWWTWDLDAGAYTDTGIYSGGDAPFIGENGNWYVGQTDTGVAAAGSVETEKTDLNIDWDFADGMPEDKGLTYTGTEGKAVMQSDGLLLSDGAKYNPPVLTAGKAVMECVFSIPQMATLYGFRLQLSSNGTKGIRLSCYENALINSNGGSNNTHIADLSTDTEYTLRIEWDEANGADVYLNGTSVMTGGITSSAAIPIEENAIIQFSGGTTLLKSLTYTFPGMGDEIVSINGAKLCDETARALAMRGGGAGITVTNTAAVGQTVRITAVDEAGQPTEWEAADMTSGIPDAQLLKDVVLTEDASINITDFPNDLDEYLVVVGIVVPDEGITTNFKMFDTIGSDYYMKTSAGSVAITLYYRIFGNEMLMIRNKNAYSGVTWADRISPPGSPTAHSNSDIRAGAFWCGDKSKGFASSATFPAGTHIWIYGR